MKQYFKQFFEEKDLPLTSWEIEGPQTKVVHFINSDVVIEQIMTASEATQKTIQNTLTFLDLVNGDVMGFLYRLAVCIVEVWEKGD